ncbi:unnamed protein product [Rotaria sordida]|uniref:Uncharacterized protein n=1 Tax=Rotaria sordida TaxID=392033 RepID=A0A819EG94_9BILA|nr:unnamed protein product [Rotaria sordida]
MKSLKNNTSMKSSKCYVSMELSKYCINEIKKNNNTSMKTTEEKYTSMKTTEKKYTSMKTTEKKYTSMKTTEKKYTSMK